MKTNDVQIEIEKGSKEEKIEISQHQQRKKEERRPHARGIRIFQAGKERGGGVAPRRNNRITESATKERREAKILRSRSEEGETRIKRKTTRREDKNERKRNKEWDTENDKKERKKNKSCWGGDVLQPQFTN